MSIIGLIFILIIVGVGLYLLNTYVPMAPPIKTIINVVVVLLVLLLLVQVFFGTFGDTMYINHHHI